MFFLFFNFLLLLKKERIILSLNYILVYLDGKLKDCSNGIKFGF